MSETPSAFKTVTRKARKEHKCCECRDDIYIGEEYQYSSGIWDGEPDSFKQCLCCAKVMRAVASSNDGRDEVSLGMLREWFMEQVDLTDWSPESYLDYWSSELKLDGIHLNKLLRVEDWRSE